MKRQKHFDAATSSDPTRRDFLRRAGAMSAAVGAAGAFGFPTIIPSSALGKDGATAPSERIVLGFIGSGGRAQDLAGGFLGAKDVQVVSNCDVDAHHARRLAASVNAKYGNEDCKSFKDFRELLANKDLDAVVVATPDHWHALASVAALDAGKDVYCEKPLTNSVYEGRAVVEAARRNDRILQTGSQERSGGNARLACERVRNGRIGKLHTIRVNLPCTDSHHRQVRKVTEVPPEQPVPANLDYDFWLGHTPKVAYSDKRCHFYWRFILAYGGGEMTDRGAHVIDIAQLANGTDDTGPVEFEAKGAQTPGSPYDALWDYTFTNTYANGVRMIGGTEEPRGLKFEGDKGHIFVHIHGQKLEASDPAILKEKIGASEINLGRTGAHDRNFLDCIRSRKQPFAHAEIGHRTASICHLNNIAMLTGRKLTWDPKAEQITNDDEANKMLRPAMRTPWVL